MRDDEFDTQLDAAMLDLRSEAAPHFLSPGPDAVRRAVRRRRVVRRVAAGTLTVAVLAGLSTAALARRPADAPVATPPKLNTEIRTIDWLNAWLPVPNVGDCPGGEVTFTNGEGTDDPQARPRRLWTVGGTRMTHPVEPSYGDVDGDSAEDAVLLLTCRARPGGAVEVAYALRNGRPALLGVALDWSVLRPAGPPGEAEIRSGVVTVPMVSGTPDGGRPYVRETARRRWDGAQFVPVDGPKTIVDVPFRTRQDALTDFPAVGSCPAMADPIPPAPTGSEPGWTVSAPSQQSQPVAGDLTGDGKPEQLMKVVCMHNGQFVGMVVAAIALDQNDKPHMLGTFAAQPHADMRTLEIKGGKAYVTVGTRATAYRWTGDRFVTE